MDFTNFMNSLLSLRKKVETKLSGAGQDAETIRKHLAFLDRASTKAESSEDFRSAFAKWMETENTILLRNLALSLGFDYWGTLEEQNIIDFYDSL